MPKPENKPAAPNPGLKSVLTFRLAQLQNTINAHASTLLKVHTDLSLTEWRIISTIHMWEETTPAKLARETQMDKGQLSRKMKNLINKNYVNATSNDRDGRQQNLCLSAEGKAVYFKLLPIMRQRQDDLIRSIPPQDLAVFNRVLDQLSANVQIMKATNSQEANDG